jgi:hypothetical protein
LWKSQLGKLKADVDQALSRVCERLLSFGPGSKKNKNKKKSRLCWVPKAPKPISFDLLAEPVVLPEVVLSPTLGYGGLEKPLAVFELSGGLYPMSLMSGFSAPENRSSRPMRGPWLDFVTAAVEDGVGLSEMMGSFPVIPEVSGGSSSSTVVPESASLVSHPRPNSGVVSSVFGLEANLTNSVALVDSSMNKEGAMVVWVGSNPLDTLVASDFSPFISSVVSGPFSHKLFSSLRCKNGLDFVSIPEGEGVSSAGIPREQEGSKELSSFVVQSVFSFEIVEGGVGDEVGGLGPLSVMPLAVEMDKDSSSKVPPRWVMERVKGYYKLVGVSCDQYEDKLLALFELIEARRFQSLADSLAKVTTGLGVKGQREIKRLD